MALDHSNDARSKASCDDKDGEQAVDNQQQPVRSLNRGAVGCKVAITGASCRLPGSSSLEEFWLLLKEQRHGLSDASDARYEALGVPDRYRDSFKKNGHHWGGFVDGIEQFDPSVFGMNHREANAADPQQRLLLEVAWEALENSGQAPDQMAGSRTGVFVGMSGFDYSLYQAVLDPNGELITPYSPPGVAHSVAANRISYALDLHGPSLAIDTACSSSFYALHMALRSLEHGECDAAIVCGVNVILSAHITKAFKMARMISPDGLCKTFDTNANGYVRAEGVVALVIRRLDDALTRNDPIMGIIAGSAINHDGKTSGMVAPNSDLQVEAIRAAQAAAGIDQDMVGFVEAHGTGTYLGDSTELVALSEVFRGTPENPCYIGSLKSNLGHLESVSGLAGLVKALMCFKHEEIPGQIHLDTAIEPANAEGARIVVSKDNIPWPRGERVRFAGVSSFGFGGANAHIILQEPPLRSPSQLDGDDRPVHVLKLTARKSEVLNSAAVRLNEAMAANPDHRLADICFSANTGRADLNERVAITARSRADLVEGLDAVAGGRPAPNVARDRAKKGGRRIAFLFSGQGAQYARMASGLFETEPVFRETILEADTILREAADIPLCDLLYGKQADLAARVHDTHFTQPALVAVEYALVRLLASAGIVPDIYLGHGVGEYVAAILDGVLTFEEALKLVARRGELMSSVQESGAMLFVAAEQDKVIAVLEAVEGPIAIAGNNGPRATVVSGATEAIERFEVLATAADLKVKRLEVTDAFHSPLMDPILPAFNEAATEFTYASPSPAFISTAYGRSFGDDGTIDAAYWTQQIRKPVQLLDAVKAAMDAGADMLIEVGPHPTLLPAISNLAGERDVVVASCLKRGQDDNEQLAENFARIFTSGVNINWAQFDAPFERQRHMLPTYPFDRQRFWFTNEIRPGSDFSIDFDRRGIAGDYSDGTIGDDLVAIHTIGDVDVMVAVAADHQVRGAAVLPATGYLSLLVEPHIDLLKDGIELSDVEFQSVLTLKDGGHPSLSVSSALERDDTWFAMVRCQDHGDEKVRPLAKARVRRLDAKSRPKCRAVAGLDGSIAIAANEFYNQLDAAGLHYGPAFRRVDTLQVSQNACQAEIIPAASNGTPAWPGPVDAAALDACLHPIAALIAQSGPTGGAWVPVAVDRLRIFGPQPLTLVSRVSRCGDMQTSVLQSFDVSVTDDAGNLWAEFKGLWLQKMGGAVHSEIPLSALRWRSYENHDEPADQAPLSWHGVVLSGAGGSGIAEKLSQVDDAQLPSIASSEIASVAGGRDLGIVLFADNCGDGQGGWNACRWLMEAATELAGRADIGRVVVVTSAGQRVADNEPDMEPAQGAVWGFCRTLRWEYAKWKLTLIDLAADPSADDLKLLWREIVTPGGAEQIAIRGGQLQVPRLVKELAEKDVGETTKLPAEFRLQAIEATGPQSVRAVPAAIPAPGSGQVRIRPHAMGLNFRDLMKSLGIYPGTGQSVSWLGDECAGVIEQVGPDVEGFEVGDEVLAVAPAAFGSRTVTDARLVVAKPDHIDFAAAATLPIVFTTAWHSLVDLAELKAGETVLIHAAAGGVGLAAIQVARHLGATIVATSGSPEKRDYLRELGIDHVIDSSTPEFGPDVVEALAGNGVDVVLNSLAGPFVEASLELLNPGGRFIEIGKRDFLENTRIGLRPFHKGLRYFAVDMEQFYVADRDGGQRLLNSVMALINAGDLSPIHHQTVPMEQAATAFRRLLRREVIGKVVLTNPPVGEDAVQARRDTYLVTGGLGALGLVTAEWLVRRGAGRVLLASRRPASNEAANRIKSLSATGCSVEAIQLDVCDREAVATCLAEIDGAGDRLKGIVHGAGVLDDATLNNLTSEKLDRVIRPKATGAWVLHELTANHDLSFFICYSSISALVGLPGLANYAAANAWLDSFCEMRKSEGRPALAMAWGPWNVGMAAEEQSSNERFAQIGFQAIGREAGIAALDRAVRTSETTLLGAYTDWARFTIAAGTRVDIELISEIAPAADSVTGGEAGATGQQLDRHEVLEILRGLVCEVTAVPLDEVQEDTRFAEIGFDSIVGLELVLRLETVLGVQPDAEMLSEDLTIGGLVDGLYESMQAAGKTIAKSVAQTPEKTATVDAQAAKKHSNGATPKDQATNGHANAHPANGAHTTAAQANGSHANGTGKALVANGTATPTQSASSPVPQTAVDQSATEDGQLESIKQALLSSDYLDAIRPDFTSALNEAKLDVDFYRAEGNQLWGRRLDREMEVLDMLGGFGSLLFGHNHPALVSVMIDALREQRPQFVQMSNRTPAGTLAKELNARLAAETERDYKTVLGSTGAEMVDAALKHALFEWAERRAEASDACTEAEPLANEKPVVLAIEGSYHGKTLGAYSLTWNAPGRDLMDLEGPFEVVWVPRENAVAAAEIFARFVQEVPGRDGTVRFNRIAGLFMEPIQGEGGIHPLSIGFAAALRRLTDEAGCPLIIDEIQSGMGRTGAFTAASQIELCGDYYLFGKSLGGGLTKTAALLIDSERYRPGFGFAHTSTFGEDDHGALVGLRSLRLLDEDNIPKRAAAAGAHLLGRLSQIRNRYPDVISEVRGCGLMVGLELADQSNNESSLIAGLSQQNLLGLVVASHLLHRSGVRVGTAITNASTLRFEPSAYVTIEDLDRTADAIAAVVKILSKSDSGELFRHLAQGEPARAQSAFNMPRHGRTQAATNSETTDGRAIFLGHMIDADDIGHWDKSLMNLTREERESLAQRIPDPIVLKQIPLTSTDGERINFEIHSLPLTSAVIERSLRNGQSAWILELINKAVARFASEGGRVVGLGGLLSVISRNGTTVRNDHDSMIITTGNTYTVGLASEAALKATREQGLDPAKQRVGIIGAAGNIGSTMVHVLSEHFGRFRLVGRKASLARVERVAEAVYDAALVQIQSTDRASLTGIAAAIAEASAPLLNGQGLANGNGAMKTGAEIRALLIEHYGEDPILPVSPDIESLIDCSVIVTASNSVVPILNSGNVGPNTKIVCDISVPSDVDPQLAAERPDLTLIRGGIAKIPGGNGFDVEVVDLPENHLLACMAETALLGFDGAKEFRSVGEIEPEGVRKSLALGRRHGFELGYFAFEKAFSIDND